MNTEALAKELTALAQTLRSLPYDARETVEQTLGLSLYDDVGKPSRAGKPSLTIAAMRSAIRTAQTSIGQRAKQLRHDVFDRRVEKRVYILGASIEAAIRAGRVTDRGNVIASFKLTGRPEGSVWYGDLLPFSDRSPLAVELTAAHRALFVALVRLIPEYGYDAIYRKSRERSTEWIVSQRFEDTCRERVQGWIDDNAALYCKRDDAGRLVTVLGADIEPFTRALAAYQAGNKDPLGIFA